MLIWESGGRAGLEKEVLVRNIYSFGGIHVFEVNVSDVLFETADADF